MRAPSAIDHAKTPDLELAELAGMGDPDAFPALFDRHFPGLYDLAARTVGDSEAAAKVVEDTFSRAWDLIASGRRVPDLRAWLYAVARKGAVSRARTRGPARSHGSGVPAAEASLDLLGGVLRTLDSEAGRCANCDPDEAALQSVSSIFLRKSCNSLKSRNCFEENR